MNTRTPTVYPVDLSASTIRVSKQGTLNHPAPIPPARTASLRICTHRRPHNHHHHSISDAQNQIPTAVHQPHRLATARSDRPISLCQIARYSFAPRLSGVVMVYLVAPKRGREWLASTAYPTTRGYGSTAGFATSVVPGCTPRKPTRLSALHYDHSKVKALQVTSWHLQAKASSLSRVQAPHSRARQLADRVSIVKNGTSQKTGRMKRVRCASSTSKRAHNKSGEAAS